MVLPETVPVHLQGRAGKTWELCLGRDYATAVEASGRALRVVQGLTELMEITPPNPDPTYERKRWKLTNHLTEILNIKRRQLRYSWNGPADDSEPDTIKEQIHKQNNKDASASLHVTCTSG